MLLYAALGCNLAWGLVDAVMYLMNALTERGRDLVTVRAVRDARRRPTRIASSGRPCRRPLAPLLAPRISSALRLRLARMDDCRRARA